MKRRFGLFITFILFLAFLTSSFADPIHDAAKAGDLQKLQQILSSNIYVDVLDERQYTALHWAVIQGGEAVAKLLIEKGANINEHSNGYSPLQLAARTSVKMALLLKPEIVSGVTNATSQTTSENNSAENETNESETDSDLVTLQFLLGRAAFEGDIKLINSLLARGVDINSAPYVEEVGEDAVYNALYYAVQSSRLNVVDLLIKKGANIDNIHLSMAVCAGDTKLLDILNSQGALDNLPDYLKASIFVSALRCGNKEKLSYLMRKVGQMNYAQIADYLANDSSKISTELFAVLFANDSDWKVHTGRLLLSAFNSGNYQLATYLLDKGVTISQEEANNALLNAARNGLRESVELLLKHGAKIDTRTEWGNTPLLLAVPHNQLSVATLLLQNGTDVNAKNELFNTPLHLAAARNLHEMSALLIKNGARVNAKNEDGNTPLHQSVRFPLKFDTLKLLLDNKANVNAQNERGMSALQYLAIKNSDYQDFDENTSSKTRNPDIQEVQYWQRPEGWGKVEEVDRVNAMKLLISNGADLSIRNKRGESVLDLEQKYSKNPEFVRFLEEAASKVKP